MQGLKLRVPNAQSILDFYESLGTMPVVISGGETLMALRQGTVDGLDNSYINTYSIGVWDSINYLHKIDYSYGAANFMMSKVKWDTLSAEDQALLKECAQEAGNWNLENLKTFEQGLIDGTIEGVSKKIFIKPTDEFIAEVKKAAQVMWDKALASDRYDHALIERLYNELYLK
jgi:TRAP-type C4-dicarboxylate transport system substrate-binding protein